MFNFGFALVQAYFIRHKRMEVNTVMTFYNCFDLQGKVIARCQTFQDVEVLKQMGRPIAEVRAMRNEEAVVCSLTSSPSDFNMDY